MATYKSHDPRLRLTKQFGGALLKKSNAKTARPVSVKHGMHVVLKSSQASGGWSFRRIENSKKIQSILYSQAQKYGVRIQEVAKSSDHLQLIVKIKNREAFNAFMRAISGMIAMAVTGAAKTRALKTKFWDYRPWTRIVEILKKYSLVADESIQQFLISINIISQAPEALSSA
ncbi:MAG: transposase [Bdellovibrio sp.]|nr:transposase [Bdellovibrio sp.]